MGARGPQPLPANVHLLRGNPSKKPIGELLGEFRPEVEIPECPEFLWPEAQAEWTRISTELHRYGLISHLDRGMLAIGCQEWARWQWAERKISEANATDPSGEKGLIEVSPSGYRMQSVYLQISVKSQERYEKIVQAFGLSPAARSRVTPSDVYPYLPGMEPEGAAGDAAKNEPATLASLVP